MAYLPFLIMKKLFFILLVSALFSPIQAKERSISSLPSNIAGNEVRLVNYRDSVRMVKVPCSPKDLSRMWNRMKNPANFESSDYIISEDQKKKHSMQMERIWKESPWLENVSEKDFQKWILPYRCADEMTDFEGDSLLRQMYAPLIRDINDPTEVFRIVCKRVYDTMRECRSDCPYTLDAYTINYIQQATCEQRCVLLVHILRQLGIPCCIDCIPFWGNYSTVGHSWVAMLYQGKTYVFEDNSKGGTVCEAGTRPVDAAKFPVRYRPDDADQYPYPIQSIKEATKVYRYSFLQEASGDTVFAYSDYEDVSSSYGYRSSIKKRIPIVEERNSTCYLCAFRTGSTWEPIARAKANRQGWVEFPDINPHVMYIVSNFTNGRLNALTHPFLGAEPDTEFVPDEEETKITVRRKYPIFSYWLNQWGNMRGSVFEAANESDFKDADTIGTVNRMPFGYTSVIPAYKGKAYRYVRYHASMNTRTPLAELQFFNLKGKVLGTTIAGGVQPEYYAAPFDGNVMSVCTAKKTGYWIGLDFGQPEQIDSICFLPKNDGNDVQIGHRYELFYFDKKWKSLGSKVAMGNTLMYYVPQNALLLLKDRSQGIEERPFLYDNSQSLQIWY